MTVDPISELLGLENLFLEEDVIRLLAYDAVYKETQIKVFPDGKEPICRSVFINGGQVDWATGKDISIYIAPFQLEKDNERLKKSDQVMIAYEHEHFGLEARRLRFLGEERLFGNIAFRLSMPKIYQVAGRRKLVRHQIPSSMPCNITAVKKQRTGNLKIAGKLIDIHSEGFCFASSDKNITYEKGDQIKVMMDTRREHFGTLHIIVKILSKAQYRRVEGAREPQIYYGCKTLSVNNSHLLALYVEEVKEKETKLRKKEQTSELLKDMYEKIKKKKRDLARSS
ncbi:MAG: hypothetical protein HQL70_03685 [Magnetococcales bacterium]|nr:hypothetical protein [Magnetococcales bacterium]